MELLLLEQGEPKITPPTPATQILNTDWSVEIPDLTFSQQSPIQFKKSEKSTDKTQTHKSCEIIVDKSVFMKDPLPYIRS